MVPCTSESSEEYESCGYPRARSQYRELVSHAVAGDVQLDLEEIPLDFVADAWQHQAEWRAGAQARN
jgi:hypothetical protein